MNANHHDSSIPTLIVFCRRPVAGIGKSRIAADLGNELTLQLSQHLLAATLEDAGAWPGPVVISPAEPTDRDWAETLLEPQPAVAAQPKGNLGERINTVDRSVRTHKDEKLIYIGSDAPLLNESYYEAARSGLNDHDIVLGAAEDGGVVLMGARTAWPDLASLPWSSENLGKALELLCKRQGLTVKHLETCYDIDNARDLPRLHKDLQYDVRPARQALQQWLESAELNKDNVT
ncbi:MAG: DUF2064 domain-containing protein [Gammaproteobacteria bacterium]|nr:DUF2064 domain-containing protein [Gammaproteobacteria bacterium]